MPALFNVTGPIYHFVRFRGEAETLFVGTAEISPRLEVAPAYQPIVNDIGGDMVAFDKLYQGESAMVVSDLNRFDRAVLARLQTRPRHGAINVQGFNDRLAVGSLLVQNNLAFEMWLYFPFFGTVNATPGLPQGYYFPAAELEGPDVHDPMGTKVEKVRALFSVNRVYDPSTKGFTLYSTSQAAFAPVVAALANVT